MGRGDRGLPIHHADDEAIVELDPIGVVLAVLVLVHVDPEQHAVIHMHFGWSAKLAEDIGVRVEVQERTFLVVEVACCASSCVRSDPGSCCSKRVASTAASIRS